jgi:L-ascorbate 6-phosphate lactonase
MEVMLQFLGQSGLRLEHDETVLYVDPYLSDYVAQGADQPELWQREFPPPLDPRQISDATAVLCTHEHADHFDPLTLAGIASASPGVRFLVPASFLDEARNALPEGQIEPARGEGEAYRFGHFTAIAVPAAHSSEYDIEHSSAGHRWLGYVIEVAGKRLYHSGDTIRHPAQVSAVAARGPLDAALLPINGRDAHRDSLGLVGNLWPREAAELAVELAAPVLIPLHYDVFRFNGIAVGQLADYVGERHLPLEVRSLTAGHATAI